MFNLIYLAFCTLVGSERATLLGETVVMMSPDNSLDYILLTQAAGFSFYCIIETESEEMTDFITNWKSKCRSALTE